jgi:hypothetical protein
VPPVYPHKDFSKSKGAKVADDSTIAQETINPSKDSLVSQPSAGAVRPGGVGLGVILVVSLISSLTTSAISLVVYDKYVAQKIVAIDVKGYVDEQRDKYLAGKMNDAELRQSFDKLEEATKRVPQNTGVIMGDCVVRGISIVKP